MCRVYNTIGTLNTIRHHLISNNIDEFNSLNELIEFQKNYNFNEEKIILDHRLLIQQEITILEKEITELSDSIPKNKSNLAKQLQIKLDDFNQEFDYLPPTNSKIIPTIIDYWMNLVICVKIWSTQLIFYLKILIYIKRSNQLLSLKKNRFEYISTNFEAAVNQSCSPNLQVLQRKTTLVKEISNTIYGAIGEQNVVNILEKLSDEYILINDFSYSFKFPIKNQNKNDYIKSIQIDHLLISSSGIFLIETKNWSRNSLENLDLFSPVQQVKRTNYALYKIITEEMNKSNWNFTKHHWGDRKIPIRNIIVFTNQKPTEEYQFVKILGVNELLSYIKYFTPCFTPKETQTIANFLLGISPQKGISSKLNF